MQAINKEFVEVIMLVCDLETLNARVFFLFCFFQLASFAFTRGLTLSCYSNLAI